MASSAAVFRADPGERLVAPPPLPTRLERWGLPVLFGVILFLHAGVVAVAILALGLGTDIPVEQEIPVEIVTQQPEPPPPEPPPEKKEQAQQQPPPQIDLKPAFDAPRAANKETVERETPDPETKAPRTSPDSDAAKTDSASQSKPEKAPVATAKNNAPAASLKPADDKAAAEVTEDAQPRQDTPQPKTAQEEKKDDSDAPAKPSDKPDLPFFQKQMAALQPIPDFRLAGAAKPSPVSGGTAHSNYLSILYGLIVPQMRAAPTTKARAPGSVLIYIDTTGHILHEGILESSGSIELDNAALDAVRRAAPFPPPPTGLPAVRFTYGAKKPPG